MIRIGTVSAFHAATGTVDVKFFAAGEPVAKDLATLSGEYRPFEPDETVLCVFPEGGEGRGACLGRIYTDVNLPVNPGENFTRVNLRDGFIEHDRDADTLTIGGAAKIILQGDVQIVGGNLRAPDGDVIASKRSLNVHEHG